MKRILAVLASLAATTFLTACHDHDRRAHTTTTSTTETSSTRVVPSATSTTVQTY